MALVEANGCSFDPGTTRSSMRPASATRSSRDFSRALAAEEWAEIGHDGALLLVTENCI